MSVSTVITGDGIKRTGTDFDFTITLDDTGISGTYGDVEFSEGVASFTIHEDEKKTARNIPDGVGYTVEETNQSSLNGYSLPSKTQAGTIADGRKDEASFEHERENGILRFKLTSAYGENSFDNTKDWNIGKVRVKLTIEKAYRAADESFNGEYGDFVFENGVCDAWIPTDEAFDIPAPTGYYGLRWYFDWSYLGKTDVGCADMSKKFTKDEVYEVGPCTVTTRGSQYSFYKEFNGYNDPQDKNKEFNFRLTCISDDVMLKEPLAGRYENDDASIMWEDNRLEFSVKQGSANRKKVYLPYGLTFKLEELDQVGYTPSYKMETFTSEYLSSNTSITTTNTPKPAEQSASSRAKAKAAQPPCFIFTPSAPEEPEDDEQQPDQEAE